MEPQGDAEPSIDQRPHEFHRFLKIFREISKEYLLSGR
jgi:hypothetical protein